MFARGLFILVWLFVTGGIGALISQVSIPLGLGVFMVLLIGGIFFFEKRHKA